MDSAVTGEYTMAYFTDRCGKTCEVTRLMGHPMGLPCGLKIGHDGECAPIELPTQTIGEARDSHWLEP